MYFIAHENRADFTGSTHCIKWNFTTNYVFSLAGFLQQFIVNGLVNVTLTNVQKWVLFHFHIFWNIFGFRDEPNKTRFGYDTAKMGLVASTYEIAGTIAVLWGINVLKYA